MKDVIEQIKEKFAAKISKIQESSARRIYLELSPAGIPEAADFIFKVLGCRFVTATGTDTPDGLEMLYHFSHDASGKMISLRAIIADKKKPQIQSIVSIITGAEWIEREIWELLGVNFVGHPNLKHLLLIDDWPEGKYPLRKDKE